MPLPLRRTAKPKTLRYLIWYHKVNGRETGGKEKLS